jgi:hypothetical protein
VSIILGASLPAIALIAQETSIDAGLWAGIALCTLAIFRRPPSASPFLASLAFAAAILLTSLALVAP